MDTDAAIVTGDCRAVMADMADAGERVQCVITSPPYWGLRTYGAAACTWGGDPACDHCWDATVDRREIRTGCGLAKLGGQYAGGGHKQGKVGHQALERATCSICSAWRGELGHEPLHDCSGWATGDDCGQCYICHLREVMRGVWSILADDGLAWVNLGDCYSAAGFGSGRQGAGQRAGRRHTQETIRARQSPVPAKNLMMVPQRFALAMQTDGWIVRRDVIWAKPNAMPESIRDRPATAHEYVWMLAKRRRYYYDADAVRESRAGDEDSRTFRGGCCVHGEQDNTALGKRQDRGNVRVTTGDGGQGRRNLRSVWTIATQPYTEAHYATFPARLVEPMILASTRPGDIVFDPFAGSGTTCAVAQRLGRRFAGAEINAANAALQRDRLRGDVGLGI